MAPMWKSSFVSEFHCAMVKTMIGMSSRLFVEVQKGRLREMSGPVSTTLPVVEFIPIHFPFTTVKPLQFKDKEKVKLNIVFV